MQNGGFFCYPLYCAPATVIIKIMTLTKQDVKEIVQEGTEELARIIAKGFDSVDERFNQVASKTSVDELKQRMVQFESKLDQTDARVGRIEADINEMKGNVVYKFEFEDLTARVKYLELKMGVESGK